MGALQRLEGKACFDDTKRIDLSTDDLDVVNKAKGCLRTCAGENLPWTIAAHSAQKA